MTHRTDLEEKLSTIGRPLVVATHRRSGTHLMIDLVRRQIPGFDSWKLPFQRTDKLYYQPQWLLTGQITEAESLRILGHAKRPIVKTHALPGFGLWDARYPAWAEWLRSGDVICCVRDGRDVMRSLHHYMQKFDASTRVPFSEFIRQTEPLFEFVKPAERNLSRAAAWAHHVLRWSEQPGALLVTYRDVVRSTSDVVETVGEHLGESPRNVEPLLPARPRNYRLARMTRFVQTRPVSTAILGSSSGGKRERWPEVFSPEDRAFFHEEAGEALLRLGFESSPEWWRQDG